MHKKSILLLAIALAASMLLSGCGTKMYELTDEEQEVIVTYAAYILAKHNRSQKDGLIYVSPDLYQDVVPEEPDSEEPDSEEPQEPDTSVPDSGDGQPDIPIDNAQTQGSVTFAQAIGQADVIEATYKGFYLTNNYKEGNYYSIDAKAGRKLAMVEVTLHNPTEGEVYVDALSQGVKFKACFDGSTWITQDSTLLLFDLSTYQGTLAPGESVDTVLMFEIPLEQENSITGVGMQVLMDGEAFTIIL